MYSHLLLHNKVPQTQRLKRQTFMISPFLWVRNMGSAYFSPLLTVSQGDKVLAGPSVSSEARLGKDPLSSSHSCGQNSVCCCCQPEGLLAACQWETSLSSLPHGLPNLVACFINTSKGIRASSQEDSVMASRAYHWVHPYHLYHVWLVRSKLWPSPYLRGLHNDVNTRRKDQGAP